MSESTGSVNSTPEKEGKGGAVSPEKVGGVPGGETMEVTDQEAGIEHHFQSVSMAVSGTPAASILPSQIISGTVEDSNNIVISSNGLPAAQTSWG